MFNPQFEDSDNPKFSEQVDFSLINSSVNSGQYQNIIRRINQSGQHFLSTKKNIQYDIQLNLKQSASLFPKRVDKFQIEDLFCKKNKTSGVRIDESKRSVVNSMIQNAENSMMANHSMLHNPGQQVQNQNNQSEFYYRRSNEVMSVKEFMYRLDTLQTNKQMEGKKDQRIKKKQNILRAQSELQERSIKAAQVQCYEGLKKRLAKEKIEVPDETLMEMVKQMNFKAEPNLRLTQREAERQLVSFVLGGGDQNQKRISDKVQQQLNIAYGKINTPQYFDAQYSKIMKRNSKKAKQMQQQQRDNGPYSNLEKLGAQVHLSHRRNKTIDSTEKTINSTSMVNNYYCQQGKKSLQTSESQSRLNQSANNFSNFNDAIKIVKKNNFLTQEQQEDEEQQYQQYKQQSINQDNPYYSDYKQVSTTMPSTTQNNSIGFHAQDHQVIKPQYNRIRPMSSYKLPNKQFTSNNSNNNFKVRAQTPKTNQRNRNLQQYQP